MSGKDTAKAKRLRQRRGQDRQKKIPAGNLREILQRVDRLRILDSRTPDEILGYGEDGLPHE